MLPWRAAKEIQGHAEGVQYRSEGTWNISRGQIIMACNVQSFGATLRVRTSHRAKEEAIPTWSRRQTDSWRLYLRHVWPHLCFSDWSLLTPPNSSSSVTRDPSCRRPSPSPSIPEGLCNCLLFGMTHSVVGYCSKNLSVISCDSATMLS